MVAGGEQSGYGILTVREQLWMFSQFYGLPPQGRLAPGRRADRGRRHGRAERQQRVSTLSTGQRQKMNFARGLLNDPWILFLDEPTLGLDVAAARSVRELVVAWKAAVPGRTVLLTTHYMAEADELCERIAIVDHGRILAIGTPDELKQRVQRESIFRLELDRLDGGAGRARAPARRRLGARRGRRSDDGQSTARRSSRQPRRSRTTARSAASSARSAAWARTSSPCASPSRRSRTSSSSSSGAASTSDDATATAPARRATTDRSRPDARSRDTATSPASAKRTRRSSEPCPSYEYRHTASPQEAADWTPPPGAAHRPARGRRPRLPARHRHVPREVVGLLRDPPAVPRDVGLRVRLSRARRRRRSTSASSCSAGR